jgi:hypothetical protein
MAIGRFAWNLKLPQQATAELRLCRFLSRNDGLVRGQGGNTVNSNERRPVNNKYKRAFSFRVHEGGSEPAIANGLTRLAGGDYPDILEDYLTISRRRQHNPTAMANLQTHILYEAGVHENAVRHYKAQTPETDSHKQFVESQIFTHRMIGHILRIIGDGIAWRAFGYDRSIPRVLSQNAVKQTIVSDGLAAEMNVWSNEFFQQGRFPIMNCITNCLAMGDVTVVSDDGDLLPVITTI